MTATPETDFDPMNPNAETSYDDAADEIERLRAIIAELLAALEASLPILDPHDEAGWEAHRKVYAALEPWRSGNDG